MEIRIKIATAVLMFHIVNVCSAYRIVSMGSTNNEVKINQAQKYLLILIYLIRLTRVKTRTLIVKMVGWDCWTF